MGVRIAVCDGMNQTRGQLVRWVEQYCALYGFEAEIAHYKESEQFFRALELRRFHLVFMGIEEPAGFLAARRLREMDGGVKLVYISDSTAYAMKGVRMHFLDYVVRPVTFQHIVHAMKLATG